MSGTDYTPRNEYTDPREDLTKSIHWRPRTPTVPGTAEYADNTSNARVYEYECHPRSKWTPPAGTVDGSLLDNEQPAATASPRASPGNIHNTSWSDNGRPTIEDPADQLETPFDSTRPSLIGVVMPADQRAPLSKTMYAESEDVGHSRKSRARKRMKGPTADDKGPAESGDTNQPSPRYPTNARSQSPGHRHRRFLVPRCLATFRQPLVPPL